MASLQALSAASQDRKARLAQLKSLKRKQPDSAPLDRDDDNTEPASHAPQDNVPDSRNDDAASKATNEQDVTTKYLSGRNFDPETRNAKLGFESAPSEQASSTLETQAAALALEVKQQAEKDAVAAAQPLDLFALQPKKPNWDLKRDLDRKLEVLNIRTDNAIARMVRERIANQQKTAREKGAKTGQAGEAAEKLEAAGIDGTTLVEAANIREREDEEDARREREEEAALLDGS